MYSPAVGPVPEAICLLFSRFQLVGPRHHGDPNGFHCYHQAHQQSRPAQISYQPWRSHQHGHRQGNLDHFPQKEPENSCCRVQRGKPPHQAARKNCRWQHHRQRTVCHRPSCRHTLGQSPGSQRHHTACDSLPTHHLPRRHLWILLAQPTGFLRTQWLRFGQPVVALVVLAWLDCCHLKLRPGYVVTHLLSL